MRAEFEVHMLNGAGKAKASGIAQAFDDLLGKLEPVVTDARCLALVRTKLEEACFFAKKGMARNPANTLEDP